MNKIILVSGLPGSGKSTIAESLAKKLTLPIFSLDPIESSIIKSGIKKSFETGLAAYAVAEALAIEQLRLGMSVIIDAVFAVKESRDTWHNLSNKHQVQLFIIECVLYHKIHKKRIESRVRNMHGMPEVTWKDVEERREEYVKWKEERLVLDTSGNTEINVNKVLKYINSAI